MALPPKKRATTSPMAPSVWHSRPVPQPAPERRTADPKTPTRRELVERAQRDSLLAHAPDDRPEFTSVGAEDTEPDDGVAPSVSEADDVQRSD